MMLTERQTARKDYLINLLSEIEKAIQGTLSAGASSMTISGRSIQRFNPDELEKMRQTYETELNRLERIEAGFSGSNTVRVWL